MFISPTTNFHLQSSSPAINTGTNVGIPYLGIAPDMGCYEYGVTTSLSNISQLDVLVSPNPTKDLLIVELSDDALIESVELYDLLGNLVLNENINNNSTIIYLNPFANGAYYLRINSKNGYVVKKIIKD